MSELRLKAGQPMSGSRIDADTIVIELDRSWEFEALHTWIRRVVMSRIPSSSDTPIIRIVPPDTSAGSFRVRDAVERVADAFDDPAKTRRTVMSLLERIAESSEARVPCRDDARVEEARREAVLEREAALLGVLERIADALTSGATGLGLASIVDRRG